MLFNSGEAWAMYVVAAHRIQLVHGQLEPTIDDELLYNMPQNGEACLALLGLELAIDMRSNKQCIYIDRLSREAEAELHR